MAAEKTYENRLELLYAGNEKLDDYYKDKEEWDNKDAKHDEMKMMLKKYLGNEYHSKVCYT